MRLSLSTHGSNQIDFFAVLLDAIHDRINGSMVGFEFFIHLAQVHSGRFIRFSIFLKNGSERRSSSSAVTAYACVRIS